MGWDERTFLDNYVSKLLSSMRNKWRSTFADRTRRECLRVKARKRYTIAELRGALSKATVGRSYMVGEGDRYAQRLCKAQLKDESSREVNNHRKGAIRRVRAGTVAGLRESRLNRGTMTRRP